MSDVSNELLQTDHKGVHEQFDMLAAAMHTQSLLNTNFFYEQIKDAPQKEVDKWIRESSARRMREMGYSAGFMRKRLLFYIFELYEVFYGQYLTVLSFKEDTPITEIQYSILLLAAPYLDNEFSKTGRADICGFLKKEISNIRDTKSPQSSTDKLKRAPNRLTDAVSNAIDQDRQEASLMGHHTAATNLPLTTEQEKSKASLDRTKDITDIERITVDTSGPDPAGDCLDCLAAFPNAVCKMRADQDVTDVPESMIAHTKDAFADFDQAGHNPVILALPATDNLYRNVAQIRALDTFTRAYVSLVVHTYFHQLSKRNLITYYILDNALRQDRFQAVCELFQLAGIKVVTPESHGTDWNTLSEMIKNHVANRFHVAYIEPNSAVNYIEPANRLGKELDCIATFRNLAPEDPSFKVVNIPYKPQ